MFKKLKNFFKAILPELSGGENEESLRQRLDMKMPELDTTDMVREQLKGITINFLGGEENMENEMEENEKKELYWNAENLFSNKAFNQITEHLVSVQGNYCVKEARTIDEVAFGRATINGLVLMREEVERLSNLYRESVKRDEDFDPHSQI